LNRLVSRNWLFLLMTITLISLLFGALAMLAMALRRVPAGQVHSVYRHGQPLRLLQPGVHWVTPGLERVGHRIDLGGQVLHFQQPLTERQMHGTVYWQVLEPERADAVIEQIEPLIRRSALAALQVESATAPEDRRELAKRLKQQLNGVLRERGTMVTRVELDVA
jgi:regulator of protease activity HflC (stomatin/prohibitin superfamily)